MEAPPKKVVEISTPRIAPKSPDLSSNGSGRNPPIKRKRAGRPRMDETSSSRGTSKSKKTTTKKVKHTKSCITKPKATGKCRLPDKVNMKKMKKEGLIEELGDVYKEVQRLNEASREEQRESKQKVEELLTTQAALRQDLQHCKNDLFQLQPPNQVSDTEIAARFKELSQAISLWVDEVLTYIDSISQDQDKTTTYTNISQLLCDYSYKIDLETCQQIKELPNLAEFLLQRTIFAHLQQSFFDEYQTIVGMEPKFNGWIHTTVEGMKILKAQGVLSLDQSMISRWRAEALASIANIPFYARVQAIEISNVTQSLRTVLCGEHPVLFCLDESWDKLHTNIVGPAAKLATEMHLSSVWYFQPPMSNTVIDRRTILKADLDHKEMKDCSTRRTLRKENFLAINDDDPIVNG